MHILYVDDERSAHTIFQTSLPSDLATLDVSYHFDYNSAIAYAKTHKIDCAFLDVSLPRKDGITLAKELKTMQPQIEFAFITGFDTFAREAYQVEGRAYLTKPYSTAELVRVLHLMERLTQLPLTAPSPPPPRKTEVFAKTFGNFDLLCNGVPVFFKNAKAKELLAYLIHQMGGSASNAQVFFALWERQEYSNTTSTYVRRTVRALREDLAQVGLEGILISHRNCVSIDVRNLVCDAHQLLHGNSEVAATFNGDYMLQYSWGESTVPLLARAASRLTSSST